MKRPASIAFPQATSAVRRNQRLRGEMQKRSRVQEIKIITSTVDHSGAMFGAACVT